MRCLKLLLALSLVAQNGCFFGLPLSVERKGDNVYNVVIEDRYTGSLGWFSGNGQRTAELNKAVAYCNGLGKKMQELTNGIPHEPVPPNYSWADIYFACLDN
jgi:hypothetical protein